MVSWGAIGRPPIIKLRSTQRHERFKEVTRQTSKTTALKTLWNFPSKSVYQRTLCGWMSKPKASGIRNNIFIQGIKVYAWTTLLLLGGISRSSAWHFCIFNPEIYGMVWLHASQPRTDYNECMHQGQIAVAWMCCFGSGRRKITRLLPPPLCLCHLKNN